MGDCGSQPSQLSQPTSLRAPSARPLAGIMRSGSVESVRGNVPGLTEYDSNNPCYESLRELFFQFVKLVYKPNYANNFREEDHEHLFHSDLATLLVQCGVNDFGLFDLLQPDPRKVKKVIHALTRFYEFHVEVTQRCSVIQSTISKANEERVAALKETHILEVQRPDLERQKAEQRSAFLELQTKFDEITRHLNDLKIQDAQVKQDKASITRRINSLQEESTALALTQRTLGQEVQALAASVVSSPDRLLGEYNTMRGRVDSARERLSQLETRITNAQSLYDAVEKAAANLQHCTLLGQRNFETRKARRDLKNQLRSLQVEETSLRTQATATSDQLKRLRAQLVMTNRDIVTRAEAAGVTNVTANGDSTVSKAEQDLLKCEAEQGVNNRSQLLQRMRLEHAQEIELLTQKFHEVEEQVLQYCDRALAELGAPL